MKMGLVYLMFCGEFLICNRTAGKKQQQKKQSQRYLKYIDYNKLRLLTDFFVLCLCSDPQALNDFLHGTNEVTNT